MMRRRIWTFEDNNKKTKDNNNNNNNNNNSDWKESVEARTPHLISMCSDYEEDFSEDNNNNKTKDNKYNNHANNKDDDNENNNRDWKGSGESSLCQG